MKILCVDKGQHTWITPGKWYTVLFYDDDGFQIHNINNKKLTHYLIENNSGDIFSYDCCYFATESEYRRLKLEKINKSSLIEPEI